MKLNAEIAVCGAAGRVITLAGEMSNESCGVFEREVEDLLQENFSALVVDMQAVDYLSSTGLRLLFRMRKGMAERQGEIRLVKPPESVYKVLRITNAFPEENLCESKEEALNALHIAP